VQEVTEKSPTSLVVEYEPTQHSTSHEAETSSVRLRRDGRDPWMRIGCRVNRAPRTPGSAVPRELVVSSVFLLILVAGVIGYVIGHYVVR